MFDLELNCEPLYITLETDKRFRICILCCETTLKYLSKEVCIYFS